MKKTAESENKLEKFVRLATTDADGTPNEPRRASFVKTTLAVCVVSIVLGFAATTLGFVTLVATLWHPAVSWAIAAFGLAASALGILGANFTLKLRARWQQECDEEN